MVFSPPGVIRPGRVFHGERFPDAGKVPDTVLFPAFYFLWYNEFSAFTSIDWLTALQRRALYMDVQYVI
jgi:hypothetical protein